MKILTLETDVPYVDAEQMMEVDRAMIEDYRIDLTQMMENAGRCLAILARDCFLHGMPAHQRVTVMAGQGGNGGGAPGVEAYVGELYLADISVPPELYREPALGLKVGNIFASSDVVRLW